ncbi:hypothetical protein C4G28_RS14690 [Vibrio parahaemolyticus]|nr:hypothetical protein [Vibrio parahaemolyticus]EJG0789580.1 hypothetical protein [Vibrio parahaemolyticus]EJO2023800.1 hypothetical protein [Vibrio parahaemolyticus]ELA8137212.1 hypothetical protein [Vibrio parahaemolyticus]ELA8171085.1 hypothetical protein [Vibrio parahaemolyticus]
MIAKSYYSDVASEREREKYKAQFQELFFDNDSKATVSEVIIYKEVVSVEVNIPNILLTAEMKSKFAENSHKILPMKVCSSVGLQNWLLSGKWISIDVVANSDKPVTNIRVTKEDCT